MRLTMQKRPRAFLFQIVTAKDRFRQEVAKDIRPTALRPRCWV